MNSNLYLIFGGVGLLITIVGFIVSIIKYIENNKKEAVRESNKYTDKQIEEHNLNTKDYDAKVDEIIDWKSEINTKMEVFNIRLEHTNKILETQSENLKDISVANQSLATSLAVLAEAVKNGLHK